MCAIKTTTSPAAGRTKANKYSLMTNEIGTNTRQEPKLIYTNLYLIRMKERIEGLCAHHAPDKISFGRRPL